MYSVWTKHLADADKKTQFNNSILGSKVVLDRAVAILKEEVIALENAEVNPKIYNLPNWDYRMAHDNGFKAGMRVAIRLLDLDQQTKGIEHESTRQE